MRKEQAFLRTAKSRSDDAIRASFAFSNSVPGFRAAYERLLAAVRGRTTLMRPGRGPDSISRCVRANAGLLALARHFADWLRPVDPWAPPAGGHHAVFASLARHLFALYPLPAFLTSAWFVLPPGQPHPEQEWYKHLGRGGSLRTAGVPLPVTRATAHHFNDAPDHYSVKAALRWAQVRALGGDVRLAGAVAATRLGRELGHEDFWLTVLRFLVVAPRLDTAHVGPVVDFLFAQRFDEREVFVPGAGMARQGPPRPDYTMKGRTVASLLRQVEEWHRELGREEGPAARLAWPRSRINELRHVEGNEQQENLRYWTIHELLDSRDLFLEGQALRHCVYIYAEDCARRQTSIWSLRVDTGQGPQRALTVEVDLARRTICQARGRANRLPRPAERAVLERWAAREGLRLAEYL
jgi:hypothetical protein